MLKAAANSDSGRAACMAIATKLATSTAKDQAKSKTKSAAKRRIDDDGDFIPVSKGGKSKYTFGGMVELAKTTRLEDATHEKDKNDTDKDSDTSSDLRLSYLDDVPLKTRFPNL